MSGMGFRPLSELDEDSLKYIIRILEKYRVDENNCMDIQFGHNEELNSISRSIEFALEDANGNSQREELLNRIKDLANSIRVSAVIFAIRYNKEVDGNFHPRKVNSTKVYTYKVLNQKISDPLKRLYTYFVYHNVDIEKMKKGIVI